MFRFPITLFLALTLFQAFAQTCTIVSSDIVCKEELMSFDVTSSSGIQSVAWDMGDGTTSSQKNFNHKYSTSGVKTVKVILTLSGGGSCTASKQITVYEIPQFRTTLKPDNIYCLSQNKVCIIDSSIGGDVGINIKKRIILWDDGDQTLTNNPSIGNVVCHSYSNKGNFKITIELTNDKDCKTKKEFNITILPDVVPIIAVTPITGCDSSKARFEDFTIKDTSDVIARIYDWGDGKKETTKSKSVEHYYKTPGFYKVSLTLIQKNGCQTKKDTLIEILINEIKFNIIKDAYRKCLGQFFRIEHKDMLIGATYYWNIGGLSSDNKVAEIAPGLGKNYIQLTINYAGCVKTFKYDSIEVVGIIPDVRVLNSAQCQSNDTVLFSETDRRYGTKRVAFLWNFGDDLAPQCTTSVKNNTNVTRNCNYATDSFGRHFYINKICRYWTLTIKDLDYGCHQEREGYVNVGKPDTVQFQYTGDRFCLGFKPDYRIFFGSSLCSNIDVQINFDSACGRTNFVPFPPYHTYKKTCNPNGWVTVGFAIKYGNKKVYRNLYDTSDYYIDPSRECFDTIWYHNWYRLLPEPEGAFEVSGTCLPAIVKPLIIDSVQKNIKYTLWDWGDNSKIDSVLIKPGDTLIPAPTHLYKKAGTYFVYYFIENKNRCYQKYTQTLILGYEMKMNFDTLICPDNSVKFKENLNYYYNATDFWHNPKRKLEGKETFKWDFGDGRGFVTDTASPTLKFKTKGIYKIRLAAKDSSNCFDTLVKPIYVGGATAGIKVVNKKIICDDIIQFFDSSICDFKPPRDSIAQFFWEFGDMRNPSFLKNPYHYYNSFGNFTIFHKVESALGCKDSTTVTIKIEGPEPKFDIVSDTVGCVPFTAEFKNTSTKTKDYIWYFGDPKKSKLSTNSNANVKFTYNQPGIYYIYLFGSDSVVNPNAGNAIYYCKATFPDSMAANRIIRRIVVLPVPMVDFLVDSFQCMGKPIVVTDNSDKIYTRYKWVIVNIDSLETTNKSGILQAKDTGSFIIKYMPWYNSALACFDTISKLVKITEINAAFDIIKDSVSCPVYKFTHTSKDTKTFSWDMGDPASGTLNNIRFDNPVTHSYSAKGNYKPCLFVQNFYSCFDTLCKELTVNVVTKLKIPNVFTPGNHDNLNDAYDIIAEGLDEYNLKIYNRWGQKLFETDIDGLGDDGNNWRGRPNLVSDFYPDGTYFYIFEYKYSCETKRESVHGTITLIGGKD